MGPLTPDQYTPGKRVKNGDQEYVVAGDPIGEFVPVAITGDDSTGVAGLLPRARLTDGGTEWEAVPDETNATPTPPSDTIKLRNADGKTIDVDPATAEVLKTSGWQEA